MELKIKTALFLFVSLVVQYTNTEAQFVRQNSYADEHQRRMQYALDDWISYLQGRYISDITVGSSYIYFATLDGGILRYHLYQNFWDYPFTTSNGLSGNRILNVTFDERTGFLGAVTQQIGNPYDQPDTCIFIPAENEWHCLSRENYWDYDYPSSAPPSNSGKINRNVFYGRYYLDLLPTYFANGGFTVSNDWLLLDDYFEEFPINSFLVDFWERIWFAINGLGIGIGNTFSQRIDVFPVGLSDMSPRTIKYFNDDLWIGGVALEGNVRSGIVQWRNSDGGWENYQARFISRLPSDSVWDMETRNDSIWFATDYGMTLFNARKNSWKNFNVREGLYSNEITDLLISNNIMFIGTQNGLNTMDLPTGIIKREKDQRIHLATIYQVALQDTILWAATNRGILKKELTQNNWQSVVTTAPIQDLPVYAVEVFHNEVWFASPGGIFWLNTATGKWESFPQLALELNGPFRDMVVNEKSVWISSPAGLLKYDRKRLYWLLFTTSDGLLDNDCYQLLMDGNYLWIATRSGISQFFWNNSDRID